MCGYAGFLDLNKDKSADYLISTVCKMRDALYHRGPDDFGCWVDPESGIALGHRRLSIIDTAATGRQPMQSSCGRFVIVYNGEIYNFREIRDFLEHAHAGIAWRSRSDTEVLLEAIIHLGIESALKILVGMFSFSFYDSYQKIFYLCRDRTGEKPLYYGWAKSSFLFGSELKSLKLHPDWTAEIDNTSLGKYLKYGYIPSPLSIYRGIYKLEPGHFIKLNLESFNKNTNIEKHKFCYWSIERLIDGGSSRIEEVNEYEAIEELESLLKETIKNQMISDVPLGAFLSGGVDSSTVVALMQSMCDQPIKTFTIGFNEKEYDESLNAKAVAAHLGTEHTEFLVTEKECLAVIPELPGIFDEPFSDPSQIPTLLLSMVTRDHVTVSLSGDGGDELFSGYNRYFLADEIWNKIGDVNCFTKNALSILIQKTPDKFLDYVFKCFTRKLSKYGREGSVSHKLKSFSSLLSSLNRNDLYERILSINKHPNEILNCKYNTSDINVLTDSPSLDNFIDCMSYFDQITYLPDDILVKLDRTSMNFSLETRVPLLDHRILEFSWRIPRKLKVRNGQGKWILRQVLEKHVPRHLIDHPKRGLGVPLRSWLRGYLREWSESLLNEQKLNREGIFCTKAIRQKWDEHISGKKNCEGMLWNILMFQAWLDNEKSDTSGPFV
ncbi:MAG: asparagine synthase (glutamine-hydrolyzing) [Desulfuromonadales bacterium]|nr:asparagine synthase (glutamine-hydrolyzing) [Desulfuromonadales bacterium]